MRRMIYMTELEEHAKQDIVGLHLLCNTFDGVKSPVYFSTELNFDKTIPAYYLMYEDEKLIAFLLLFMPEKGEAEVTAYTHPEYRRKGCFRDLCEKAKEVCKANNIWNLLYAVDSKCKSGQEACAGTKEQKSIKYSFSEYKMRLKTAQSYEVNEKICFWPVTLKNSTVYREVAAEALDMDDEIEVFLEAILSASNRRGYLEYWNGIPVGVCHVSFDDKEACIYGLGILKDYRGKGLGKQFVRYILHNLTGEDREIVLEVDADNQRAYHLYQSCGFETVYKTDYYEEFLVMHGLPCYNIGVV